MKKTYTPPRCDLAEIAIENGIAASDSWYRTEQDGTNIGWSYGSDEDTWG